MRPRQRGGQTTCFNEAAGIPRGRREYGAEASARDRASMRPRVFPAEDSMAMNDTD